MKAAGIIFSDTHNNGLDALTNSRSIASLPFGSRYRLIDFVLSNMVNSGIRNVGVVTKSNYQSLMEHLGSCQAWDLNRKNGGLIFIPPFATGNSGGYKGKLDELYTALRYINETCTEDYLILADSATVSNIDYNEILESHIRSGSDVTVAVKRSDNGESKNAEMLFDLSEDNKIQGVYLNYEPRAGQYISLGTYVVGRKYLESEVVSLSAKGYHSLSKDFIQEGFNKGNVRLSAFIHDRPVLRNYDIEDYFNNNLGLINPDMQKYFFGGDFPVYTTVHDEVPTFYGGECNVRNCLIADGCVIEGEAEGSVLFRGVTVEKGAIVRNSIIMDASVIKAGACVENVIIDKKVRISSGVHVSGYPTNPLIISKGETI